MFASSPCEKQKKILVLKIETIYVFFLNLKNKISLLSITQLPVMGSLLISKLDL